MSFQLHPQLAADTHLICRAENCQILLMDDARFPWIVLVPEVSGIRELYELNERQQQQAYQTILHVSKSLAEYGNAEKITLPLLVIRYRSCTFISLRAIKAMPPGQGRYGESARLSPIARISCNKR